MELHDLDKHLSDLETSWRKVQDAHQLVGDTGVTARNELLLRYYSAVRRYLLGMLHNAAEADELTQEFAVRFLRGDFRAADPRRGRFRDFIKTAVRRLVLTYWQRQKKEKEKGPLPLPEGDSDSGPTASGSTDVDPIFDKAWREALLARTWKALFRFEELHGHPYYTVLRAKTEQPELRSTDLARQLSARLGKMHTEAGLRQMLHRARRRFAALLVTEVADSLPSPDSEAIEQELIELGLLDFCRQAMGRRGRQA
jgi:RNA polymerase sigma-70 factor (ECF subfamily)